MTRKEIEGEYKIDNHGRIASLGKFQGEMVYVPYFWDAYLNGCADDDTDGILTFTVTAEDVSQFPELVGAQGVKLQEDGNGFVHSVRTFPKKA